MSQRLSCLPQLVREDLECRVDHKEGLMRSGVLGCPSCVFSQRCCSGHREASRKQRGRLDDTLSKQGGTLAQGPSLGSESGSILRGADREDGETGAGLQPCARFWEAGT